MAANKYVEYKSANDSGIVKVIANKGICWQVEDDEGNLFLVQKKHVTRGPWEESEDDTPAPAPLLTAALAQIQVAPQPVAKPEPRVRKERAPADPNATPVVSLKELCFDLDVVPRIARRRLRKALGQVGTGHRWEWELGSQELEKVKQVLLATAAPADAEEDHVQA